MNATNPENSSAESTPTQWMMKQLKDLSGSVATLQTKQDTELKHLSSAVVSLQTKLDTEIKRLSGTVVSLQMKLDTEIKRLSGTVVSLQTKLDTELKHLPTQDDVSAIERDMATIRERTTHLATKADMNLLKGISSVIAVAAVSIAIKLIFFGGS